MLDLIDRACIALWGFAYKNVDPDLLPVINPAEAETVDLPMPSYLTMLVVQAVVFSVAWMLTR